MRAQKGITLIALVITIIVMLILVGVSITMAVQGGLFNYASNAVTGTNQAITNEGQLGSGKVNVTGAGQGGISNIVDFYVNGVTVGE